MLLWVLAFSTGVESPATAQYTMQALTRSGSPTGEPMTGGIRNYKTFSRKSRDLSDEVVSANKGFEKHPELGLICEGAPEGDVYELLSERTDINRTFVKKGTMGTVIYKQTASAPINYKDANGFWRTIKSNLEPDTKQAGVYSALEQPAPISINATSRIVSIGTEGNKFQFNNDLELIYLKPDGTEVSLGNADWHQHTAGDEGVYVTSAWPGIDIEMHVVRGAVKTNFLVMHAFPEFADGQLIVRDHPLLSAGLTLYTEGKQNFVGNLEVRNNAGETQYNISAATACEKGNIKKTLEMLEYRISGKNLDIVLPGNFLNRGVASYPVIIDPLVSLATSSVVNGSTYSAAWTVPCVYANAATVPANITITDIQYAFTFESGGAAWIADGAIDFRLGTCRSPTGPTGITGLYWCCSAAVGPGTCAATGGTTYSMYADLSACIPPPQCPSYNLNLTMDFYQDWAATAACATTYEYATTPLVITVIGHTVEFVSATASATTICSGSSTNLTGTGEYGVPPYTYTWTPGPVTGSPVTVSPTATTTYTLTITDACGNTATGTRTITVNTDDPITGTPTVCVGNTTALADASGAGTWTSSNTAVATVSGTGVVTGVSAGTATITYHNTATGCTTTLVVTVTPLPSVITGTTTICVGATSLLADATGGGTWTSSNPAVATINATTGLVTALATGTTTITYSLGGACVVTTTVTVDLLSAITGPTAVCLGATITLTDVTAGGTWTSSNTAIATVSGTGVVTGVAAGTVTITYTTPTGCSTTATVTVNDIAPITGTTTLCVGTTSPLADAAGAGTWTSSNTAVATVSGTGVVTGVGAGTATITFQTAAGCTATIVVTINDVSAITGTTSICSGQIVVLTDATGGGTWLSSNPGVATIGATTGSVTGIAGGTATMTYTSPAGCTTTTIVTVTAIAPIAGTPSACVGATSVLSDPAGTSTWSSSNTAIATVGATTGVVNAIAAGTATISFTNTAGCSSVILFTVNGIPVLSGTTSVCAGATTNLSADITGGTWSCTGATATVGATTGVVSGIASGTESITYTSPAGCTSDIDVTVNPIPAAITGPTSICQGFTATLADATVGGSWTSSNTAVATIDATGVVTGISGGTSTISYTSVAGCVNTLLFTVNATPPAITGATTVCVGSTANVTDAMAGGTWTSGNTAIATIDATSGMITGITTGTVTTYISAAGCMISTNITVNPLPTAFTGKLFMCVDASTNLTDAISGGTWTSSDIAIATVDGSGTVTGVSGGNCSITYTVAGCSISEIVTVNPIPPAIGGLLSLCTQASELLTDGIPGGSWSTSDPAIALIDPTSGNLKGMSNGIVTVTYTAPTGCLITGVDTVEQAPKVSFYVSPYLCIGDTVKVELTSSSPTISSYTWNFGSANVIVSSSNTFGPYYISFPTSGTQYVTVTGNATVLCPSLTAQDTVLVHAYPNASIQDPIQMNGGTLCTGDSVMLRAAFTDVTYSYFWAPTGYFLQNNIPTVYGRIDAPGYVTLTIHDQFGCTATDSILLNPQSCCQVSLPSAFSPNGDGLNDIFRPVNIANNPIEYFMVMNRWGQCVFQTVNGKSGWDGTFGGQPQDIGVYYYALRYDCNGRTVDLKGEVTLIR